MAISLTSPLTGGPQTGFTSPTYTLVTDAAIDANGYKRAVSALGGTQAGVDVHSVSRPFTVLVVRPKVFRSLGVANPVTGVIPPPPMNVWHVIAEKGMTPLAGQASVLGRFRGRFEIPAGVDIADPANVRALFSLSIGALWDISAEFGDSAISGIL